MLWRAFKNDQRCRIRASHRLRGTCHANNGTYLSYVLNPYIQFRTSRTSSQHYLTATNLLGSRSRSTLPVKAASAYPAHCASFHLGHVASLYYLYTRSVCPDAHYLFPRLHLPIKFPPTHAPPHRHTTYLHISAAPPHHSYINYPPPHQPSPTPTALALNLLKSAHHAAVARGHFGLFQRNITFEVDMEVFTHVLAIIPAIIIGVLAGIAAVIFSVLNLKFIRMREKIVHERYWRKIGEPVLIILLFVSC